MEVGTEDDGGEEAMEEQARMAAARKVQSMVRGKHARLNRARVARHVLSLATPVGIFVPADTIETWFT